MWKTWLLRGATLAVVAILAGAWAVSLIGSDAAPASSVVRHEGPDQGQVRHHHQRPVEPEKATQHRHRHHARPTDSSSDGISDVADLPSDATSAPTTPGDPDTSTPDDPSSGPTHSPSPHPTPTPTPTEPSPTCTDLGGVIDCVLDPITDRP